MVEEIASWAKKLDARGVWIGKIIKLLYEICVAAPFQSAIHILASCILAAFCYKDGKVNIVFLVWFFVPYIGIIIVFSLCNVHRKHRNDSTRFYESSFPRISRALQEECRKDIELYNRIVDKDISHVVSYYKEHDVYTESCFRICAAVDELLQEISGNRSFRVVTFLRTTGEKDQYCINAYSPQSPTPEAYKENFNIDEYREMCHSKERKKIPVHARPFLNKRVEPIILKNREVKDSYYDFNDQHPTKLHISIPCTVNNRVVAVLQITSYCDCLGAKSSIKDLIENSLVIFTSYLKVIYMHQIEHELLSHLV